MRVFYHLSHSIDVNLTSKTGGSTVKNHQQLRLKNASDRIGDGESIVAIIFVIVTKNL